MKKVKKILIRVRDKFVFFWRNSLTKIEYGAGKILFPKDKRLAKQSLDRLNVIAIRTPIDANKVGIDLPSSYRTILDRLYIDALRRMSKPANCILRSADKKITDYVSKTVFNVDTWNIPEVKNGMVGTVHLKNCLELDGLNELASFLLPQIESLIYNSPLIVDNVSMFRRLPSPLPEFSSILWHSDNHFEGVIKIMFYLNDVGEKQAPFEYLRHSKNGEPVHVKPKMPQFYPQGRVPEKVIETYKKNGYEAHKVIGPKYTMLVFDDKVIHKGNYAEEGYRDVLVLQLKPSIKHTGVYISPRWTSAF